jgi:hypothetical protein
MRKARRTMLAVVRRDVERDMGGLVKMGRHRDRLRGQQLRRCARKNCRRRATPIVRCVDKGWTRKKARGLRRGGEETKRREAPKASVQHIGRLPARQPGYAPASMVDMVPARISAMSKG